MIRLLLRVLLTLVSLVMVAAAPGCLPTRFTIDLAPNLRDLDETRVIDEQRTGGAKIALLDLTGSLSLGSASSLPLSGERNVVDRFVARLEKAERDNDVKALLVRINSPGGTVAASETLYNEIVRFRERTGRPVVVSMGEVATSGGYYVALAGDRMLAQEATVTGSIGVIIQTFNVSDGLSRIGVDGRAVISRPNKDIANPFEPVRAEHYEILQGVVDEFYAAFRERVRERRPGIDRESFDRVTDGRVLPGADAAAAGLVDGVATLRGAFESAKELAGVDRADLVAYAPKGLEPASLYAASAAYDGRGRVELGGAVNVGIVSSPGGAAIAPRLTPGVPYYVWSAAAAE